MRRHLPALCLYLVVFAACLTVTQGLGCGSNSRTTAIQTSLVAVNAARDGFVAYDRQHQIDIADAATSKEEAKAQLQAYRKDRELLLHSFEVVYRALAIAATQNDAPSLTDAVRQATALAESIKKLTAKAEAPPAPPPAPKGP